MDEKKLKDVLDEEEKDLQETDITGEEDETPPKDDGTATETESDEGKSTDDGEKTPPKKRQTRETNAYYAELRRKNERLEREKKELETKVNEADFEARKKVVPKTVLESIGLEKIETQDDLMLAEAYKTADEAGDDNPLKTAMQTLRNMQKEKQEAERKLADEQAKNYEAVVKDQIEFKKKFGIETKDALKDERFVNLYKDLIKHGNFTELYTRYKEAFPDDKPNDNEDLENAKKASIPPLPSGKKSPPPKKLHELEGDEFLKAWNEFIGN